MTVNVNKGCPFGDPWGLNGLSEHFFSQQVFLGLRFVRNFKFEQICFVRLLHFKFVKFNNSSFSLLLLFLKIYLNGVRNLKYVGYHFFSPKPMLL